MTGLETAIILVAFVITAAFAFVVLNMGFLTAEKAQSVIGAGMREAGSSMLTDGGVIGQRSNVTGDQSDICLEKLTFYLKLSQGERA
ncbi:flagellin, partial [Candidatus Bathyarchaeota archaeon]|nr:flagellin [Candidatus Bathyarchaeota archaeon]